MKLNYLKTYENFVYERVYQEDPIFYNFVDIFYNSDLLTLEEKVELNNCLNQYKPSQYLILEAEVVHGEENKTFFDKLKARFPKASQVVKNFSDQAKSALDKLVNAAKTATDFVKKVCETITKPVNNLMTNVKAKLKAKLQGDEKFKKAVEEVANAKKEGLIKDLKTSKEVVAFYKNKFLEKFTQDVTKSVSELITGDKQPVVETLKQFEDYLKLNEKVEMGNNVIQKLVHGLEAIPPFSWLEHLKGLLEKGINSVIQGVSYVTQKLGGPAFAIPVISSVVALALEYNIKGLAKHGLIEVVSDFALPFVGTVIKSIGIIATVITAIELIDDISGLHILGGEHNKAEVSLEPATVNATDSDKVTASSTNVAQPKPAAPAAQTPTF